MISRISAEMKSSVQLMALKIKPPSDLDAFALNISAEKKLL